MEKMIGFIGCGNMAMAIIGGMITSNNFNSNQIIVSNPSSKRLLEVNDRYNVFTTQDNCEVAKKSDILILAVKPNKYQQVIKEIEPFITETCTIVNIAAGITTLDVENLLGKPVKCIKVMPNTPSLVGEGMSALSPNRWVSDEDIQEIRLIFLSCGQVETVDEFLMDAVTAVSGSAPAYVFLFIEAMADAAVLEGMPRHSAYKFAAQAVLGSAKMVLETGKHPGELKDQVCSPGGTTIEAVTTLEKTGFRQSVISAMQACSQKSKEMTKKK